MTSFFLLHHMQRAPASNSWWPAVSPLSAHCLNLNDV
jgi:hypothetical protein